MNKARRTDSPPPGLWRRLGLVAMVAGLALLALPGLSQPDAGRVVHVLEVEGPIGPATREFVIGGIEDAQAQGVELVVLRMDTPGGLDSSMRDMIKVMLNAEVPVATWVGPSGSRAASAGTYMLYASHVAAMAPSTHLGAATPVQVGGGGGGDDAESEQGGGFIERLREAMDEAASDEREDDQADGENGQVADAEGDGEASEDEPPARQGTSGSAQERKAIEDAVAYIRGLAERHGRNADWAERAVRESVSLTASEALEMNVIDLMAETIEELLNAIDGQTVSLPSGERSLQTAGARIEIIEPDWRIRLLSILSNPTLAFLLFMVGVYGLILEGYNPGALVPGVIGGICLLLALYSFQILPVNFLGLALMVLGFALIAVELFVPSFGILGIGGVIAVVLGSVVLMDTDVPGFGIHIGAIAAMGLTSALVFLAVVYLAARSHRNPRVSGTESLIGRRAESISDFANGRGRVHIEGEDWSARGRDDIVRGDTVEIVAIDGLVLDVKRASAGASTHSTGASA
ncbi:MAG: NfeD family protein [Wenzhouxiangella sp.]